MKKLLSILLVSAVLFSMAACNTEEPAATTGGTQATIATDAADDTTAASADDDITADTTAADDTATGDIVSIKWIQVGSGMPTNYDAWKANIDQYAGEKIGVHLDMEIVSWGDWGNRRPIIVNTNEPYDILFTNMDTYSNDVELGAFADITDMVKTQTPDLFSLIPGNYWDASLVNGSIYAVPTYKDSSMTQYFVWDKELADQYEIEYSDMHELADVSDALYTVQEGEDITPFILSKDGFGPLLSWYDAMGTGLRPMGVRYDDGERKVVSVFEQDDVMRDLKQLHQWYKDGIINSDAATLAEVPKYRFFMVAQGWSGAAATTWGPGMDKEAIAIQYGDTIVSNETVQGSLSAISASSANPEKALELLQLVNTDSYLRDALYYGLEGDDFEYTDDNKVHRLKTEWPMAGYTQGTFFNVTQLDDVDFNQWDEVKELNENANPSVLLGFSFDRSSVVNELANCNEIYLRYVSEVLTGTVDPETAVPEMIAELNDAGFQTILEEAQSQIDTHFA